MTPPLCETHTALYTGFLKKTVHYRKKAHEVNICLLSFKYIWMWRVMPGFWQCTPAIFIT